MLQSILEWFRKFSSVITSLQWRDAKSWHLNANSRNWRLLSVRRFLCYSSCYKKPYCQLTIYQLLNSSSTMYQNSLENFKSFLRVQELQAPCAIFLDCVWQFWLLGFGFTTVNESHSIQTIRNTENSSSGDSFHLVMVTGLGGRNLIPSAVIRLITKSDDRAVGVRFVYHE